MFYNSDPKSRPQLEISTSLHMASRQSPYPHTKLQRFPVFDKYVSWVVCTSIWFKSDLLIYSQQYKHVTTSWKRSGQRSNSYCQSLQIELQILGVFAEESVLNSKLHVHAAVFFNGILFFGRKLYIDFKIREYMCSVLKHYLEVLMWHLTWPFMEYC